MNKKIQYQQNIDIINKFFKRPITLITGIISILSAFTFSVAIYYCAQLLNYTFNYIFFILFKNTTEAYTTGQNITFLPPIVVNVFPVLFGIAFIILYFFSEDDGNKTNSVSRFFEITSLISAIISAVTTVAILVVCAFLIFLFGNTLIFLLAILSLAIGGFLIVANFSRFRFAKSINNSVNSIYLNKKGSVLFSVTNFVCAFFSLSALLILLFSYFFVGSRFFISTIPLMVFLFLFTAEKVCWGITSVIYSKYIQNVIYGKVKMTDIIPMSDFEKKVTDEFLFDKAFEQDTPTIKKKETPQLIFDKAFENNNTVSPFSFADEKINSHKINTPVSIIEQPTVDEPAQIETKEDIAEPKTNNSSTDDFALDNFVPKTESSDVFNCPDCGAPFGNDDFFCNVCGRKLI